SAGAGVGTIDVAVPAAAAVCQAGREVGGDGADIFAEGKREPGRRPNPFALSVALKARSRRATMIVRIRVFRLCGSFASATLNTNGFNLQPSQPKPAHPATRICATMLRASRSRILASLARDNVHRESAPDR